MRKPLLLAAALAVSAASQAHAQGSDAGAQIDPERLANIQRAAVILRTFNIAFESREVQQPVKGQLLSCLYNNKLGDIAAATDRVFDNNPNLKRDDAGVIYRVAAGVCGITFQRVEGGSGQGAAPPPRPPAASGSGSTEGR